VARGCLAEQSETTYPNPKSPDGPSPPATESHTQPLPETLPRPNPDLYLLQPLVREEEGEG